MASSTEPIRIGRYEIKGELGRGGMAVVYRGFDPQTRREVAVKVLPPQFLGSPDFRTRFEREAHTIAQLEHPAIVPLYDYGEDRGQLYFVMRLMPGGSLADRLRQGALPLVDAARIISRLAAALDEAHARGIVHRDLKPGNILFDSRGDPYVSDFGIAKIRASGTVSNSGIIGTPAYMSPEQARGERDLTGRSDIYALGTIVFEMLTGKLPYQADTPMGLALRHIMEPVPHILDVKPDLPDGCSAVIERAMAKDPADRYAAVTEMAHTLAHVARGDTATTVRARKNEKPATVFAVAQSTRALPVRPVAVATPPPRRRSPLWGWALLGSAALIVSMIAAGIVIGAFAIPAITAPTADTAALTGAPLAAATDTAQSQRTATQQALTQTAAGAQATSGAAARETTQAEQSTQAAILSVTRLALDATATAEAGSRATATAEAAAAEQAEATAAAFLAAPRIAFFKDSDIWLVTADASVLRQITTDGGKKTNLRWLPDGQTIAYISGQCIQTIHIVTGGAGALGCFYSSTEVEGFEISPDSKHFAISVDRQLFIGGYDPAALAPVNSRGQLEQLASCMFFTRYATKYLRWSADSAEIAVTVIGVDGSDIIARLGLKCGSNNPPDYDQFPGGRFQWPRETLQNFGWDGADLFALVDSERNDGFGQIYIYNSDKKQTPKPFNPLNGCCYRDPNWSLDGKYFVFAFQDRELAPANRIELYYASYNNLLAGGNFSPIPLPDGFFGNPREKPQPAIAPAAP